MVDHEHVLASSVFFIWSMYMECIYIYRYIQVCIYIYIHTTEGSVSHNLMGFVRWLRLLPPVRVKSERRFEWPQRFFERDLICRVKKGGKARANLLEIYVLVKFDWTLIVCCFSTVVDIFVRTFWAVTYDLYESTRFARDNSLVYHHASSKESVAQVYC